MKLERILRWNPYALITRSLKIQIIVLCKIMQNCCHFETTARSVDAELLVLSVNVSSSFSRPCRLLVKLPTKFKDKNDSRHYSLTELKLLCWWSCFTWSASLSIRNPYTPAATSIAIFFSIINYRDRKLQL